MQDGFCQKVVICMVLGVFGAGVVEFYRHFVNGANEALNGNGPRVHMTPRK